MDRADAKTIVGTLTARARRVIARLPRTGHRVRRDAVEPRSRRLLLLALALSAFAFTTAPALSATAEGPTTASEARALHAAQVLQEREARIAQKKAEAEQLRRQRLLEREEHRALALSAKEPKESGTRKTPHGYVEITCTGITWHFEHFSPGPHTIGEIVYVDGERLELPNFRFEGESGENLTPLNVSAQKHRIDAHAKWVNNGARGDWDIASQRPCGSTTLGPKYEIEKRQKIVGSGAGFVTTPLTGEVGQKIEYQILVHNVGSVFIYFSGFSDPHCDPGTIKGGLEGPLAPGGSASFTCTHVITPADQVAGSYTNTASVNGTPPTGGTPIAETTNTVVVTVLAPGEKPKEKTKEKEKEKETSKTGTNTGGENPNTSNGTSGSGNNGATGVLGTTSAQGAKSGTLAVTAGLPGLSGRPQGCVRSSFVVRMKSKGVKSVVFYLDNHRLKSITVKSASAGTISIRISVSKLKVGVHHLKAKITMRPLTASTKAVTASRTLTFARCASSSISPRFTG
jgi:hypothetical protein